jgi:hypothetical protein
MKRYQEKGVNVDSRRDSRLQSKCTTDPRRQIYQGKDQHVPDDGDI